MMQAIETTYNKHRFRSRLEARWAVFFDALNIKWQYEPKWYNLEGVCYLPDFWLPDYKLFAEVKPTTDLYTIPIDQIEKTIALSFAIHDTKTRARVALFLGTPYGYKTYAAHLFVPLFATVLKDMTFHSPASWTIDPRNGFGPPVHFVQCLTCRHIRIKHHCDKCNRNLLDASGNPQETVCLTEAYQAVQTTRFPDTVGERIKNVLHKGVE